MPDEARRMGQERKIRRSESRWLQKALFALSKAGGARAKLARIRGCKIAPMIVIIEGDPHEIDTVTSGVREAVQERLDGLWSNGPKGQAVSR